MDTYTLLGPAAVLVLWSLIVLIWMVITRFKAFAGAGITLSSLSAGSRYVDAEEDMPARVNWVSHNYTNLMEQPTLFYAIIAILVLVGDTSGLSVVLAWVYVGLRIIHSAWQILSNGVLVRAIFFMLSTFCLFGLAINAVRITIF